MTTTVPLSALATSVEDIDSELTPRFLFPAHDVRLMEYLWGLEIHTIDPTHERSVLYIRKSTETPFRNGINGSWFLIPTEETLGAMRLLQERNITVPISERTSFLDEFAAQEYEYIFIPDDTDIDFLVLEAESAPQRFSAPYTDFPQVTSSANPFFVTFHARPRNVPSVDYRDLVSDLQRVDYVLVKVGSSPGISFELLPSHAYHPDRPRIEIRPASWWTGVEIRTRKR
ncbi:hypothetical protein DFH06DRAFT_1186342 [Mycena polygramma]|nr:hypothetical protein DFH06DRAFT_1186342 [Mycena polygramma]